MNLQILFGATCWYLVPMIGPYEQSFLGPVSRDYMHQRSVSVKQKKAMCNSECLPPPSSAPTTTNTTTLRWSWHVLVYASNCIHCIALCALLYVSNCGAPALPPFLRAADPLWLGPCVLGSSVLGSSKKRVRCNKCSSAPSCFMHPVSDPPQSFKVIEILEVYFVIFHPLFWKAKWAEENVHRSSGDTICSITQNYSCFILNLVKFQYLNITCFVHPVLQVCICLWLSIVAPFAHLKICKDFLSSFAEPQIIIWLQPMILQIFRKHCRDFILIFKDTTADVIQQIFRLSVDIVHQKYKIKLQHLWLMQKINNIRFGFFKF